jgi:predicted NUDIX family NTP pyrophosphohydrolase
MPKQSAGLLVYRATAHGVEVLAVHPGGPFWAKKDVGAWSLPKGELDESEIDDGIPGAGAYRAARREFSEELGFEAPAGEPVDLGVVRQSSGKVVHAWALECTDPETDLSEITSNTVELEWPKNSGRILVFPEVDRAAWMSPETAREKLIPAQVDFVERLLELVEPE